MSRRRTSLCRTRTNEAWTLSEHRGGNVVLVFYPFSFSRLCTSELHDLTKTADKFAAAGAEVVGISIDSRQVWRLPRGAFRQSRHPCHDKNGRIVHKGGSIEQARDTEAYLKALESCPV